MTLTATYVRERPAVLEAGVLYVVVSGTGEIDYHGVDLAAEFAHFRCPCGQEGCEINIRLRNGGYDGHPSWQLSFEPGFRRFPTLEPSIRMLGPCGSHFRIIRGVVVPC